MEERKQRMIKLNKQNDRAAGRVGSTPAVRRTTGRRGKNNQGGGGSNADLPAGIKILFVAGFGPVAKLPADSKALYAGVLKLPLQGVPGNEGYLFSPDIPGVKHFALWPLEQASLSCFGTTQWPADRAEPQAWLEFDVEDLASATAILKDAGYELLTNQKLEPWGQTVTRFLSPEGILTALSYTPHLRK